MTEWTQDEYDLLKLMLSEKTRWADISERLGRSKASCMTKARRDGTKVSYQELEQLESFESLNDPAERECLKCRKTFDSANKGNRMCSRCRNSDFDMPQKEWESTRERFLKLPELM